MIADGGEIPSRLCDLAQQGRYAEKRGWRSQSLVQMRMVL
jgi:hypothetical protein